MSRLASQLPRLASQPKQASRPDGVIHERATVLALTGKLSGLPAAPLPSIMACRFFINDGFTVVAPLAEISASSGAPGGSAGKPVGSTGAATDVADDAADVDGSS